MSQRITRSRTRHDPDDGRVVGRDALSVSNAGTPTNPLIRQPTILPVCLTRGGTDLSQEELDLLQLKKDKLQLPMAQVPMFVKRLARSVSKEDILVSQAVSATLVFAQAEAGTAVCVSPSGILLTCAHCVAESELEFNAVQMKWLLFASGQVVKAKCIAIDFRRDLALLQVIAAQEVSYSDESTNQHRTAVSFPYARVADTAARSRARLICVGHPGSEDLEASQSGLETGYDVLHISEGKYAGVVAGQDLHDNSDIGALQHTCWTYWGHSGAPLIEKTTGKLIGLHSSWDDETGMRRGVPLQAIKAFLDEHGAVADSNERQQ